MTVLHTGATKKFVQGWEHVFGGQAKGKTAAAKKKSAPAKKPAKKSKSRGKR